MDSGSASHRCVGRQPDKATFSRDFANLPRNRLLIFLKHTDTLDTQRNKNKNANRYQ